MQSDAIPKFRTKLEGLRDHLTKEIRRLDESVADHEQVAGDLSHVPSHPADRDSEGIETTLAVEHSEWEMLNQVDAALQRIDEGSYGRCQDCGCEIPRQRLDVIPYATCCVGCEEKREQTS